MYYKEDYKYTKAKKVIESLSDTDERDQLIKYYIEKQKHWYDEQNERLKEYHEFFNKLDKFLPNKNIRYGG